jgi:hypothetical protein
MKWSRKIIKFIYFNCACAKLIRTHYSLNRPGATMPDTRMRKGLCSPVSQRLRALVNTGPKGACPFQFCFLLHLSIISPMMPSISCCYVVVFVCVPVSPCVFLENRVVCCVNRCVSSAIVRCLGIMLQLVRHSFDIIFVQSFIPILPQS